MGIGVVKIHCLPYKHQSQTAVKVVTDICSCLAPGRTFTWTSNTYSLSNVLHIIYSADVFVGTGDG